MRTLEGSLAGYILVSGSVVISDKSLLYLRFSFLSLKSDFYPFFESFKSQSILGWPES